MTSAHDSDTLDAGAIARRAAARALAERGNAGGARAELAGVHVAVTPPPEPAARPGKVRGRELVDAASLRSIPDGGELLVPGGAVVTELARDEARRRGIRLVPRLAASASGRATARVALGADHGGFALKGEILAWLKDFGAVGVDLGTRDANPCDYPDFARAVARAVAAGEVDFGILVDGAGIGSAIAANKVPGVRAANCSDVAMARNAREHNFANVLTLGAKLPRGLAWQIVQAFLATPTGAERHARRVDKITDIERAHGARPA